MGHTSSESTAVYLRLNIEELRCVALDVPVSCSEEIPGFIINTSVSAKNNDRKLRKSSDKKTETLLQSRFADEIEDYLRLKRSLGREYKQEAYVLASFNRFIAHHLDAEEISSKIFLQWSEELLHLSPNVRRSQMLIIRKFCLYRQRLYPQSFIPDLLTFPKSRPHLVPHIIPEADISRLLRATEYLPSDGRTPLRSLTFRLAIVLLYTTGIRRGELLNLKLKDYNSIDKTLTIRESKFHKSRIIPLSPSTVVEVEAYLKQRSKNRMPMDMESYLIWNAFGGPEGKGYTGTGLRTPWVALCKVVDVFNKKGSPPRIHDLRHTFAVSALQRWYNKKEDVQAKLPLLALYMGHVSIVSTHYYLQFIEGIRSEVNNRFYKEYGKPLFEQENAKYISERNCEGGK